MEHEWYGFAAYELGEVFYCRQSIHEVMKHVDQHGEEWTQWLLHAYGSENRELLQSLKGRYGLLDTRTLRLEVLDEYDEYSLDQVSMAVYTSHTLLGEAMEALMDTVPCLWRAERLNDMFLVGFHYQHMERCGHAMELITNHVSLEEIRIVPKENQAADFPYTMYCARMHDDDPFVGMLYGYLKASRSFRGGYTLIREAERRGFLKPM